MFDRYRANRPKRSVLEQVPGLDMFEEDSPVVSIAEIVAALAAGTADAEPPPPPPPRIAAQVEMEKLEGQIRQQYSKLQRLMAEYERLKAFLAGKPVPKAARPQAPVVKPAPVAKPQPPAAAPVARSVAAAPKPAIAAASVAAPSVSATLPEITPEAIALAAAAEAALPVPTPNPPVPVRVPETTASDVPQPVPRSKYTVAALAAEPRGKSLAPRRRAPHIAAE